MWYSCLAPAPIPFVNGDMLIYCTMGKKITLKKVMVEPSLTAPYSILVCLAKSSAESIGESILSTVRKAAKLAVYEEIMISVKNHHIPPTILVERALGISSDPVG